MAVVATWKNSEFALPLCSPLPFHSVQRTALDFDPGCLCARTANDWPPVSEESSCFRLFKYYTPVLRVTLGSVVRATPAYCPLSCSWISGKSFLVGAWTIVNSAPCHLNAIGSSGTIPGVTCSYDPELEAFVDTPSASSVGGQVNVIHNFGGFIIINLVVASSTWATTIPYNPTDYPSGGPGPVDFVSGYSLDPVPNGDGCDAASPASVVAAV